jgi:very-short-patch-repair endonuclease
MRLLRVELAKRSARVSAGGSRAELDLWEILEPSGLPIPVQQFVVIIDGQRFVLDYAWPQWKIVLEYDSWAFHEGTLRDHVRDRHRISMLNLAGWLYLGATEHTTPRTVLRMVTEAIEQRSGRILAAQAAVGKVY